MKSLDPFCVIKECSLQETIFFTEQGIITQLNQKKLLLPFSRTVEECSLILHFVHEDAGRLLTECSTSLTAEEMNDRGFQIIPPRDYFFQLADQPELESLMLRSTHWSVSNKALQFCSYCGAPLEKIAMTTEKKCGNCHRSFFPKLSPAILALIQRGEEILLGRGPQHPPGMYSVLAGFIDLGESAEAAVHREVREEVNLEIANLTYFGSQSWPFPDSFMMAFQAEYLEGEITIDPKELEDARWFHRDDLPLLPPTSTLSRKLIDAFLK